MRWKEGDSRRFLGVSAPVQQRAITILTGRTTLVCERSSTASPWRPLAKGPCGGMGLPPSLALFPSSRSNTDLLLPQGGSPSTSALLGCLYLAPRTSPWPALSLCTLQTATCAFSKTFSGVCFCRFRAGAVGGCTIRRRSILEQKVLEEASGHSWLGMAAATLL